MDSDLNAAMRYLSSPAGSFWKWDDKGEVVVWTDGSTIAFREELAAILGRLEPQGLPQIDAVMLLVAATRGYWSERSRSLKDQLAGRTRARDSAGISNPAPARPDRCRAADVGRSTRLFHCHFAFTGRHSSERVDVVRISSVREPHRLDQHGFARRACRPSFETRTPSPSW